MASAAVLVGDGAGWPEGTGGVPAIDAAALVPERVSVAERLHRTRRPAGSTGRSATTRLRSG